MRYLVIIPILMLPLSVTYGQKDKKHVREGNREYNKSAFEESEVEYRRALDINPNSEKATFNLGDVFYRMGKYEEASGNFNKHTDITADRLLKAASLYNRGNSLLKAGKLEESIESYKSSLLADPANHQAKYNLAYAQDLLKQQQQQQQQQQQDDKNKNSDQQDGQDKEQQNDQDNKGDQDKNQQQDNPRNQNQDQQEQAEQPRQGDEQKMTKDDAERLLQALANEEKEVQEKVKKEKAAAMRVKTLKNW